MTTILPPDSQNTNAAPLFEAASVRPVHSSTAAATQAALPIRLKGSIKLLIGVVVAVSALMIYNASTSTAPLNSDVPLITADDTPVRERPEDAGGMQVPNRDSTVYEAMRGNMGAEVEQVIPPAEQPVDAPATLPEPRRPDGSAALTKEEIQRVHLANRAAKRAEEQAAKAAAASTTPAPTAEATVKVAPEPAPKAAVAKPAPVVKTEAAKPVAPVVAPKPVAVTPPAAAPEVAKPATTAAIAPNANGGRIVQLGAVRSEAAAQAEWKRLQAKFPAQLGKLAFSTQKADLGAKGVYWRIRAGSVTESDARKICAQLTGAGQSCIVAVQ